MEARRNRDLVTNMKTLTLTLLVAGLGLAQNSITVRVVKAGVESVAKISGIPAAAGIEVIEKWAATQTVCVMVPFVPEVPATVVNGVVTVPAVPAVPSVQACTPKFANVAEVGKEFIVGQAEGLAAQFPSSASKAEVDDVAARQAALEAKRRALFAAARAEKP